MPKIPTAKMKQASPVPSKGEELAEHLTNIAIMRGLYYTALYDKLGENLKIFSVAVDEDYADDLWARTQARATPSKCGFERMTCFISWMATVRRSTSPRSSDCS
jgi:hypothetical protein